MPRAGLRTIGLVGLLAVLSACPRNADKTEAPKTEPVGDEDAKSEAPVRATYGAVDKIAPEAERYCTAVHGLVEHRNKECCGRGSSRAIVGRQCKNLLTAAMADGALTVDEKSLATCESERSQSLAGCDWVGGRLDLPESCGAALSGTRAAGKSCRSSLECSVGLVCAGVSPSEAGRCAEPATAGKRCGTGIDPLAGYVGLAGSDRVQECAGFCANHKCRSFAELGERCVSNAHCGPHAHCNADKVCAKGAAGAVGEACLGGGCDAGSTCVDGLCQALKPAGQSCGADAECIGGCVKADGNEEGVCGKKCR